VIPYVDRPGYGLEARVTLLQQPLHRFLWGKGFECLVVSPAHMPRSAASRRFSACSSLFDVQEIPTGQALVREAEKHAGILAQELVYDEALKPAQDLPTASRSAEADNRER